MKTSLNFVVKTLITLLVSIAMWGGRVEAVIYPVSSSLDLHAEANAGTGLVTADYAVRQTTGLNPLSASVVAGATNGTLSAVATSSATATWTSAAAGQFTIDTRFTTDDLSSIYDSRVATGSPGWFYTFTSDQPASLVLDYVIAHTGFDPYSTILVLNQSMGGTLVKQVEFSVPPVSGTLSLAIAPNVNYTLQIFDDSNINQNLSAFTSEMTGTFSFQITPVPEPGDSLFLGAASGAIGALCRRRHRT